MERPKLALKPLDGFITSDYVEDLEQYADHLEAERDRYREALGMMEYMTLIGAEDVRNAGQTISSASQDIMRAANIISESLQEFKQQVDRLEQLLERAINYLPQGE